MLETRDGVVFLGPTPLPSSSRTRGWEAFCLPFSPLWRINTSPWQPQRGEFVLLKTWLVFKDTHEFRGMPDFAINTHTYTHKLKTEENQSRAASQSRRHGPRLSKRAVGFSLACSPECESHKTTRNDAFQTMGVDGLNSAELPFWIKGGWSGQVMAEVTRNATDMTRNCLPASESFWQRGALQCYLPLLFMARLGENSDISFSLARP